MGMTYLITGLIDDSCYSHRFLKFRSNKNQRKESYRSKIVDFNKVVRISILL